MADMTSLIGRLSRKVQPTDPQLQFSDMDFQQEIMDATYEHTGLDGVEALEKEHELPILYKAMSSCYYLLAAKTAENIRFKIQNDEYFGNQQHEHYLSLAKKYEEMYEAEKGIQVNTVTRRQVGTGRNAPYYPGDKP